MEKFRWFTRLTLCLLEILLPLHVMQNKKTLGKNHPELVLLRRFRHVIVHGYSFSIDDHRLKTALMEIVPIPEIFCETIGKFLDSLNADTAT